LKAPSEGAKIVSPAAPLTKTRWSGTWPHGLDARSSRLG
jgi:hypothetical protein